MTPRHLRVKLRRLGLPVSAELDAQAKAEARRYRRTSDIARRVRECEERRKAAVKSVRCYCMRRVRNLRRQGLEHLEAGVWNWYRRELEKLRADRLGAGSSAGTARG